MRELADASRIERFMRELGHSTDVEGRVYLTGGATAVLNGWRESTVDIDIKLIPDHDRILRAIPRLKEELHRFPAIDPKTFRASVEALFGG